MSRKFYTASDMQAAWESGYNTHAMGGRLGGFDDPIRYESVYDAICDMAEEAEKAKTEYEEIIRGRNSMKTAPVEMSLSGRIAQLLWDIMVPRSDHAGLTPDERIALYTDAADAILDEIRKETA